MGQQTKFSQFQRSLLNPEEFTLTFELVPSRGGRSKELSKTLDLAKSFAADSRLQAVSITENAGGHPVLSPEVLGIEIRQMGLDVIIHFSCKDKNRNQMESLLFAWDRLGLRDLLVITGDYPKEGYQGYPKPVFDLGSVHVLNLISRMNRGNFAIDDQPATASAIQPTSFFMGVALSPFKRFESELIMQYSKLHRKVAQGADYVITQVGFDARKFHEALLYIEQNKLDIPILGNVFIPNLTVTELMYRGEVPGCIIPEPLYADIQREARSDDKGKKARLVRAAKLLSILKGMGYSGAHIGGPGLTYRDIDFVLNQAEQMTANWREFIPDLSYWPEDWFHYFEKDGETLLNSQVLANRPGRGSGFTPQYTMAKMTHDHVFEPDGALFHAMKNICSRFGQSKLTSAFSRTEHFIKFLLFDCQNCGDCTLAELAFVCPQSGCAKYLLNGACGGSRDGWCEVYPGQKRCLYVRVYERLKAHLAEEAMKEGFIPPRDWSLNNTSSWINFFLGLDHTAKKG